MDTINIMSSSNSTPVVPAISEEKQGESQSPNPILSHVDANGEVRMVDISSKPDSLRKAIAEGFVTMKASTLNLIAEGNIPKGDVFACARVAGIMAAKQTPHLIPLCHPLLLTSVKVECKPVFEGQGADACVGVAVKAVCELKGKTGIEMEALTACSVACLTIYDMCKAVDKGMTITDIRLLYKEGGKSGVWEREEGK